MRGYTCGYADGPFGQIHFRDTGVGRPLILLHQAPMSSRQFDSVYHLLAKRGVRGIGIDYPGFGGSEATKHVPTIADYAAIVPPVLNYLKLDKVDVLGHHTGALVATEFSLSNPQRTVNLILNGPLPMGDDERSQRLQRVKDVETPFKAVADGSHLQRLFARRAQMTAGNVDLNTVTRYIVEGLGGYGPFWYGHHAAFTYDHAAAIKRISHRTLILTNTGDEIYENAKHTKQMRPDFDYIELQGGGVDIVDQQPEEWAEIVSKFVQAQ